MGLLDDAIREHLDLKRRRGADPTDIERAEREALGPVRRVPEPIEPTALAAHADELAYDLDPEEDLEPYDDPDARPRAGFDEPPGRELDYAGAGDWRHDDGPWDDDEKPEGANRRSTDAQPPELEADRKPPPHPAGGPAHPGQGAWGQQTAEYHEAPEDAPRAGEAVEEDGDDVLEETPDFLQDAPDHDRLWFEQRPPRDFDFDS